jgi:hypothetical protein
MSKRRTFSLRALVSCVSVILAVLAGGGSSAAQAGATDPCCELREKPELLHSAYLLRMADKTSP